MKMEHYLANSRYESLVRMYVNPDSPKNLKVINAYYDYLNTINRLVIKNNVASESKCKYLKEAVLKALKRIHKTSKFNEVLFLRLLAELDGVTTIVEVDEIINVALYTIWEIRKSS